MATTLHPASTIATRQITTRRPRFEFPTDLPRHFAGGDLVTSHLVALLSAIIPEGERFVVEAVKRFRSEIEDPALRQQANAFVGQESVHQREHENLNGVLAHLGYPTRFVHGVGVVLHQLGRRFPRRMQLACTAAIEHWTAVLAEHALGGERPVMADVDPEIRAMLTWHLIEEIEHKSVAFDIMQAFGTTEQERLLAMRLLILLVGPGLALGLLLSLAKDPAAWNPANIRRSLRTIQENAAFAGDGFGADLRSWRDPGFHPDQRDHSTILERWIAEAFGPGSIVDQRSARTVAGS